MKRNFIALCALLLAACGSQEPKITLFSNEAFQTEADGKPVGIYTLRAGDVTMQVTNYGARVVALWTPDRAGDYEDIVLGYETIDRYINNDGERFLGAVVGPYANRIAKGSFTLDGTEYNLPINNNGQTLHGGNRDDLLAHARKRIPDRLQRHDRQADRGESLAPPLLQPQGRG